MGITVLLFFLFYMIDQVTKFCTVKCIGSGSVTIIPNFCDLRCVFNEGMAFGLASDKTWILVVISAIASVALMYIASKNDWKRDKVAAVSITMALAGCVGNLYDRFMTVLGCNYGGKGVVDMIHLDWFDAFIGLFTGKASEITMNVADIFLVVGIILFAIDYAFFYEKKKHKDKIKKNKAALAESTATKKNTVEALKLDENQEEVKTEATKEVKENKQTKESGNEEDN